MNPHQGAPLGHDSETGDSSVDAAPERTMAQSRLRGLQHLPTELLLEIANSLSPSSIIFLTRTCRRIHHDMGVSIEKLLGGVPARRLLTRGHLIGTPRTQPLIFESYDRSRDHGDVSSSIENPFIAESSVQRSERLIFLCMLEREHQIDPSRAACSSCVATHDVSLFSPDSLNHQSDKRECLGRAGRMWICPRWQCSYDEVHYSTESRYHCGGATAALDPTPFVAFIRGEPLVRWPLIDGLRRGRALPYTSQVTNALQLLTASVCPHIAVNDPFVLRHYSRECRRLKSGSPCTLMVSCTCKVCQLRDPDCSECGTSVYFDVVQDYPGTTCTLGVCASRRKGTDVNGVTDPAWIKQLAFPPEFEALERAWNESTSRLASSEGELDSSGGE